MYVLVNGYGLNGRGRDAVDLYYRMPPDYIDEITYVCVLNACSHSGMIDDARRIFNNISHPSTRIITVIVNESEFGLCCFFFVSKYF